jgi:hypothetical protein
MVSPRATTQPGKAIVFGLEFLINVGDGEHMKCVTIITRSQEKHLNLLLS